MYRFQPILVLLAVLIGLTIGQFRILSEPLGAIIIPALILLLITTFIPIEFESIRRHMNKRLVIVSVIINFLFTPLLAYFLGFIFLSEQPMLWIGLVMLLVTPCTDWYLVFISLAKGNAALGIILLPINLLLQVLLLPLYLYIFFGTYEFVGISILIGALFIVFLPLMVALFCRMFLNKKARQKAEGFQLPLLLIAVVSMFATNQPVVLENISTLLIMFLPLLLFFLITLVISSLSCRQFRFNYADSVTLTMTTLARNSPIALAIALIAFPNQPLIAVALILGSLVELPILTLVSYLFNHFKKKDIQFIKN